MLNDFFQDTFKRFSGNFEVWYRLAGDRQPQSDIVVRAIEHIVDGISRRLRGIPGYRRRLEGPVTEAFHHIDELIEQIPGPFMCSRSTFTLDPRVRTFFASPQHLQEVFSSNKEVREIFNTNPLADECCVLLCMHMEELQKFGVALSGDRIQREVLQTTVNFRDHQLYSPCSSEDEARLALKCCILNGLLDYIRSQLVEAKNRHIQHKQELGMLRNQLRRLEERDAIEKDRRDLQLQIETLENTLVNAARRPPTLEDLLGFVSEVLGSADQFISAGYQHLRLNHMGVKVEQGLKEPAYDLDLVEIRIAKQEPRVAALVRFPRSDLLPEKGFLEQTGSLFAL